MGSLNQVFRIFTDPNTPAQTAKLETSIDEYEPPLTAATGSVCVNPGERNATAGVGVFIDEDHALNRSLRLPLSIDQSTQSGALVAAITVIDTAPAGARLTVDTKSETLVHSLSKWQNKHEDEGYIMQKNGELTRITVAKLRARRAHTILNQVNAKGSHVGITEASSLAREATENLPAENVSLEVDKAFLVSGAKLATMTQKLAYRAIRQSKDAKTNQRPRAAANIKKIADGLQSAFGISIREETIWSSLSSRHLSRECRQFMWKTIHDGFMVGSHWLRPKMSDDLQARAKCKVCANSVETMDHILFECEAVGQAKIWESLKQTWELTEQPWYEPSWGTALGAACVVLRSESGHRSRAAEQLWTILWSESMYLIWKMRCERVIGRAGRQFTAQEVMNRWYATINQRLSLDRRTAAISVGKRSLNPASVEAIWTPVLDKKDELPEHWVVDCGVLVGIKRGR
ncbi:hypothetical protein V8D89_002971 [Ganoderma adspersum]